MAELELWLVIVSFSGFFISRWMLRLAPFTNELPLKTIIATVFAAVLGVYGLLSGAPSSLLIPVAVLCPLFIFAPLALSSLARQKQFSVAKTLTDALYWSDGRLSMRRLLSQVALQQGNAEQVFDLIRERDADALLLAQVYSMQEKWDEVLALDIPDEGDNAFLGLAAKVKALLALDQLERADDTLRDMQERWDREGQGPIGYRSLFISELRLLAERGQGAQVRNKLQNPPPGIAAFTLYEIMARAAEQSGQFEQAGNFYVQAFATAPEGLQPRLAAKLESLDLKVPKVVRQNQRPIGTIAMSACLLLAFATQSWLNSAFGPAAANVTAGFLDRVQGVPDADGLWRHLSYAFVHGGLLHVGMNTWVLFDVGRLYELRRNWGNLLAAFVIGTIMGAYFSQIATSGGIPLVGASAGVLGVAGALLADVLRRETQQDKLLLRSLMQWMVFIVVFSVAIPNVSLWGHVGGVIGGVLWGFVRQGLPRNEQFDKLLGGISIGLMVYVLYAAFIWFSANQSFLNLIK